MFTEQSRIAAEVRESLMAFARAMKDGTDPASAVDATANSIFKFTNCAARLAHRGPVDLGMTAEEGRRDATLTLHRYPRQPDTNETFPQRNGWALDVAHGAARFQGGVLFAAGACGAGKWAKATVNGAHTDTTCAHVLGTVNTYESYFDAVECDIDGVAVSPTVVVRVQLWRSTTSDPNVRVDDIVPYCVDADGNAFAVDSRHDEKIGSSRDIIARDAENTLPQLVTAYTSGRRGWYLANGSANDGTTTTTTMAGLLPYGYSGAGAFATAGASVTSTLAVAATNIDGTGTITLNKTTVTSAFTVTGAEYEHSGPGGTISANGYTLSLGSTFIDDTVVGGGTDTACFTSITSANPIVITIDNSVVASALHNHAAVASTVAASGGGSTIDLFNISTIADALSIASHTPTTLQPAGRVMIVIQRLN